MGNLCCAREHSVQFFVQFFFSQLNCTVYGAPKTVVYCQFHLVLPIEHFITLV